MRALTPLAFDELEKALRLHIVNFVNFTAEVRVEELETRSWASVTFSGARHRLRLRLSGAGAAAAAGRFLDNLGEAEFVLRGHILADIALAGDPQAETNETIVFELEALTVEDA